MPQNLTENACGPIETEQQAEKREHAYAESLLWGHLLHSDQQQLRQSLDVHESKVSELIALNSKINESLNERTNLLQAQVSELNLKHDKVPENIQDMIDYQLDQLKELTRFCVDERGRSCRKESDFEKEIDHLKAEINELRDNKDMDGHRSHSRGMPSLGSQGELSVEEYMQNGAKATSQHFRTHEVEWTRAFIQGLNDEALRKEISEALDYSGWTWSNAYGLTRLAHSNGTSRRETRSRKKKKVI